MSQTTHDEWTAVARFDAGACGQREDGTGAHRCTTERWCGVHSPVQARCTATRLGGVGTCGSLLTPDGRCLNYRAHI